MPVPGPRTQQRPLPGYTNPAGELPDRINHWGKPPPVAMMGETPGLKYVSLRGNVLGFGQIRHMWRQAVNLIPAGPPYSWSSNGVVVITGARGFEITRALRYLTRSLYMGSGIDNTHFYGLHTEIAPRHNSKPVTLGSGLNRGRPTVRNRVTSFGSRVPTLNQPVVGAEPQ
jgi:hypothetical protein